VLNVHPEARRCELPRDTSPPAGAQAELRKRAKARRKFGRCNGLWRLESHGGGGFGNSWIRFNIPPPCSSDVQTTAETLRRRGRVQRDSFDRLLVQHLPAAQRFAIRLTGDAHQAEDLLHDAVLRAVKACDSFEGRSAFTTWLFRIVVNCFRDRLRVHIAEPIDPEMRDGRSREPASQLNEQEIGRLVAQRVSSLPARQREVLVLVVYEDMSVCDVAEVLGISQTNVRVNLSYARARLKEELREHL
jgi:RNA polymerase sigma-70 factor (ECF subfamily)